MRGTIAAMALLSGFSAACEKNPFCPDEVPMPERVVVTRPNPSASPLPIDLDSGIAIERGDPPPLAGDMRAEIDAFRTIDACVAQHSALDPLVGDAVRALGYDTLVRDACRMIDALRAKDASACAMIASSGVQARCEALVAMEKQDADACPWIASADRTLGRDPMCLAVSAHDPRVCAAALLGQRSTCEALATGDPKRCSGGDPDVAQFCAREFEREKRVMVAPEHDARDLTPAKGTITIKGEAGTSDPEGSPVDVSALVRQGIVVAANPTGGMRIDIAHDLETGLHLPTRGGEKTRFVAALVVVSDRSGEANVDTLHVSGAKIPPLDCPTSQCAAVAHFSGKIPFADWTRGTPVTLTIEGRVASPSGKWSFDVKMETFVRDVVTRSQMYAPRR